MKKAKSVRGKKGPDVRVAPVVAAIDAATALMTEETSLLVSGQTAVIEPFLDRKKEAEAAIAAAGKIAADTGLSVVAGSAEAQAVEVALENLRSASVANAEALQGARDAAARITGLIRKVSLESGSEGMYSRNAKLVHASGKANAGFGASV